jgi:4-diphosphocytidyl-2-C-methyl-D-erythritol kinase
VVRAGLRLANHLGYTDPQALHYQVLKQIPVSAGLAGGSADAAAALLATDAIWCSGVDSSALAALAGELGSDVPFSLLGGTALGTERGENLEPIPNDVLTHWVLIPELSGLSTPLVYKKLDEMRLSTGLDPSEVATPQRPTELIAALRSGDLGAIALHMHNDLEQAAIALMPSLADTIERATSLGGLRAMVSGSGPTVAVLCESAESAKSLSEQFTGSLVTRSTKDGSYLELGC